MQTRPNASEAGREIFRRGLETAIAQQDPRFKAVRVDVPDAELPVDRTLQFRIRAVVQADPAPETMAFDTTLDPVTHGFTLETGGDE